MGVTDARRTLAAHAVLMTLLDLEPARREYASTDREDATGDSVALCPVYGQDTGA